MKNKEAIKKFCEKHSIAEAQFSGKEKVGGDLYLRSVTALPEGFNPTVGGDLDLRSVTALPEGFNPTVGGYLVTKNSRRHIGASVPPVPPINKNFKWEKDGKIFAKIDGIFCQLLTSRENTIEGGSYTIYSAKKVNRNEYFFITNKDNFYAHGEDLKKAVSDLQFKIVAEKLKNEPIKKDTLFTVMYYRTLTGACDSGCRGWMKQNGIPFIIDGDATVLADKKGEASKGMKAADLLPLLEKTKPYGYEKFKQLITF